MLIVHQGNRCYGCPFFSDYVKIDGTLVCGPMCNLDGMVPSGEAPLIIKIEDPEVQPGTCPFQDPHGISVEVSGG